MYRGVAAYVHFPDPASPLHRIQLSHRNIFYGFFNKKLPFDFSNRIFLDSHWRSAGGRADLMAASVSEKLEIPGDLI